MKQVDTNSIRFSKAVNEKLDKLAFGFKRSKKELFTQMVDYFYRSKKDPSDFGDEVLKRELSSGISRIISFIRQQEKDFLLPSFTDVGLIKVAIAHNNDKLSKIDSHLVKETEISSTNLKNSQNLLTAIKMLIGYQKQKEELKKQFSELLEYYILSREEMGWTTTNVKKEQLVEHVRQSLNNM
ncbi:BfmA/BtgA family mobilization protein [Myroides sp. N17-2]|uniref:BfmA/BtgA family mobilization protein n=1 Tax=Myroides sp. N17-2 TaxID=2030799 RepID=UPI000EFC48E4|nr:BfmA/BtgA family mobilization protein [Myroides sp. N17-2]